MKKERDILDGIDITFYEFDNDYIKGANQMRVERSLLMQDYDLRKALELSKLPVEKLEELRVESIEQENAVFEKLQAQAKDWSKQAAKTKVLDNVLKYLQTPVATHTDNKWVSEKYGNFSRSNAVYQMRYQISTGCRNGETTYVVYWHIYTNSPALTYGQIKIAGQEKRFSSEQKATKYLDGRIKAYDHLFEDVFPPIPKELQDTFSVNGLLLPGYAIEK